MNEHSSLSRYLTRAVEQCGAEGSGFFFHEDGLDFTGVERSSTRPRPTANR